MRCIWCFCTLELGNISNLSWGFYLCTYIVQFLEFILLYQKLHRTKWHWVETYLWLMHYCSQYCAVQKIMKAYRIYFASYPIWYNTMDSFLLRRKPTVLLLLWCITCALWYDHRRPHRSVHPNCGSLASYIFNVNTINMISEILYFCSDIVPRSRLFLYPFF